MNGGEGGAARLYLDANASEPLRPQARRAVIEALDVVANPSSVHALGRAARRVLEDSRERVAAMLGVASSAISFTAGATEANAIALSGAARDGRRVLASAIEHDSVLRVVPGIETVPVTAEGTD
ncbi:MAG: aminotransferase class V-fold PLP-dependent enzyme [Acetobacteraceae bacterium]|nr:aminotransferase class V-fold PLP-dependent enzyme [Acetobacteraceae bacterium]